ncbi:MAG: hypothetical protein ACLRUZ_01115 [Faecalimonas sp.]
MKLEKKYYIFTAGLTILSILMAIANTAQPLIVEQFINQLGKSEQNVLFWAAIYFLSIIVILTVEMIRKLGEAKICCKPERLVPGKSQQWNPE